ncbi:MAG TPA: P-loop NTPase [Chloroflexota bacterium]|nr:P-loop NTPase [Chloroflexota bacterium]
MMLDEAAIRASLAGLNGPTGALLLAADEVVSVVIEDRWAAVVLGKDQVSVEFLRLVHDHLWRSFPDATFEVRTGSDVFRGGSGFGQGRHVVAVLGGKGGVGKSTVAVSLALTLSAMGLSVGLLDADLNGPDIPHMLGVHPRSGHRGLNWKLLTSTVTPPSQRPRPQERYRLEVMSVGFVVPERLPLAVTGRALVSTMLRYLIFGIAWSADVLVIDAPPGTGEELQVMAHDLPLSGAIFVTTPQDLAQMDAERTLGLLTEHGVPVIGLVQNMAGLTCPHCAQEIDLFSQSTRLTDAGVRVLGRIPFDVRLSVTADQGEPLVLGDPRGPIAYEFAKIGLAVRRALE